MDETDPKAWLVRQWRRLVRRWPWASKARLRRLAAYVLRKRAALVQRHRDALQVAVNGRAAAEKRADSAEALASRMREVIAGLCEHVGGERAASYALLRDPSWLARGRALLREVEPSMPRLAFAAMCRPVARIAYEQQTPFREHYAEMVSVAFKVGLSEGTPPELVADEIAARVRAAVMQQWQHQSVLTGAPR